MFDYWMLVKVLIASGSLVIGVASYKYFGMKEDNFVEETAESIIQEQTGASVDLSPNSPEKK